MKCKFLSNTEIRLGEKLRFIQEKGSYSAKAVNEQYRSYYDTAYLKIYYSIFFRISAKVNICMRIFRVILFKEKKLNAISKKSYQYR